MRPSDAQRGTLADRKAPDKKTYRGNPIPPPPDYDPPEPPRPPRPPPLCEPPRPLRGAPLPHVPLPPPLPRRTPPRREVRSFSAPSNSSTRPRFSRASSAPPRGLLRPADAVHLRKTLKKNERHQKLLRQSINSLEDALGDLAGASLEQYERGEDFDLDKRLANANRKLNKKKLTLANLSCEATTLRSALRSLSSFDLRPRRERKVAVLRSPKGSSEGRHTKIQSIFRGL